jgi:hypothetical protein
MLFNLQSTPKCQPSARPVRLVNTGPLPVFLSVNPFPHPVSPSQGQKLTANSYVLSAILPLGNSSRHSRRLPKCSSKKSLRGLAAFFLDLLAQPFHLLTPGFQGLWFCYRSSSGRTNLNFSRQCWIYEILHSKSEILKSGGEVLRFHHKGLCIYWGLKIEK